MHDHVGEQDDQRNAAPPLIVDGAKSPDSIPDDVAYHLFLTAIAPVAGESADMTKARDSFLRRAGLAIQDRQAVLAGLGNLRSELADLSGQRDRVGSDADAAAKHAALKAAEDERVRVARDRLEEVLSAEGRARLDEHVRTHVKSRIKIFG